MNTIYTPSHAKAWETVRGLIDGKPYAYNEEKTRKAGYHIYTFKGGWVSDLNDRLEVNFENGSTYSVRIEEEAVKQQQILDTITQDFQDARAIQEMPITQFIADLIGYSLGWGMADRGDGKPKIHLEGEDGYLSMHVDIGPSQKASSRNLLGWSYIYQVQFVLDTFRDVGYINM